MVLACCNGAIHFKDNQVFMPAITKLKLAAVSEDGTEATGLAGTVHAQHAANHLPLEQPQLKSGVYI